MKYVIMISVLTVANLFSMDTTKKGEKLVVSNELKQGIYISYAHKKSPALDLPDSFYICPGESRLLPHTRTKNPDWIELSIGNILPTLARISISDHKNIVVKGELLSGVISILQNNKEIVSIYCCNMGKK